MSTPELTAKLDCPVWYGIRDPHGMAHGFGADVYPRNWDFSPEILVIFLYFCLVTNAVQDQLLPIYRSISCIY